jgi:HEAT repeat protein
MTYLAKDLPSTLVLLVVFLVAFVSFPDLSAANASYSFTRHFAQGSLTPLQFEIERQARRLDSVETEERRDAVTRLGSMHHPAAARAALPALHDSVAIVRATAAAAILSLPPGESAAYLIPLLVGKDEFVRREVAFALGKTHNQSALIPLIERLNLDKKDSVRGAAAVALGELKNESATVSLAEILSPSFGNTTTRSKKKSKKEKDLFLLRAAAHSLGQIGSSAGLPALVAALSDEKTPDDVRRESADALGLIGDPAAIPALRSAEAARDPYLAEAARQAVRKIERRSKPVSGN